MFVENEFVKYEEMSGVVRYVGTQYITIDISNTENTIIDGIHVLIYTNEYHKIITSRQSEK